MAAPIPMAPSALHDHPYNAQIYGRSSIDDLVESIRHQGMLEPIVATPDRVIISGHRRRSAALALGLLSVPVVIRTFDEDEVAALVEFNRYRRKTWSQVHAECQVLLPRLKHAAAERRHLGAKAGGAKRHGSPAPATAPRSRVIEDLERCTGLNRERLRRVLRIFEAVGEGRAPEEIIQRLDSGTLTVHQAYRIVRKVRRLEARQRALLADIAAGRYNVSEVICPFDVWQFPRRDDRFGRLGTAEELLDNSFGAPPPQLMINLLHYYTAEGDLVIDPMAGNGTMADVALYMQRRCLNFDLHPKRPEIVQGDALDGPPSDLQAKAALLFLDPPYGEQRQYSGHPRDLCNAGSLENYLNLLDHVLERWLPTLAPNGRVALVMGSEYAGGLMVDRAWAAGRLLDRRAPIERRIQVPYPPTMFSATRVAAATDRRLMLSRICEIFVAKPCLGRSEPEVVGVSGFGKTTRNNS